MYNSPKTKLKKIMIKKNMGWCDDPKSQKYNSLIKISKKFNHEKMFRNDGKYDLLIPIKYNMKNPVKGKGSAIFLHLTKDYKSTNGCIALKKKDFLILLKLIDQKTKIKII
jgi:L,D-peptidoglycan transpeptidase YkuD (ErfK/YbiS/YcfS/YnhG family)